MPTTEKFVIDLPSDMANMVRSRMQSGGYATESEVIQKALLDTVFPPSSDIDLEHWIRTEGVRRLDYLKAHPETAITFEQMEAFLDEDDRKFDVVPEAG